MIMRVLAILLLFVGLKGTTFGEEPIQSTIERLATVQHFAFGGVGFAGTTSAGEKDFRVIRKDPWAIAHFARLYRDGNIQAKLYALAGMREIAPQRYQELAKPLRESKEKVSTMHGCIVADEAASVVVEQIAKGDYDSFTRRKKLR